MKPKLKNIKSDLAKCKHPNSRKTNALAKQMKKSSMRDNKKKQQFLKQNLIGEKIVWFRDNLKPDIPVYSPKLTEDLIKKYLGRFDEELQQITLKHSIGGRKNRQHASREDVIRMTQKSELEEYNTCGIEVPDLLDPKQLSVVRNWNGELRFLQNIKLCRIGRDKLKALKKRNKDKNSTAESAEPNNELEDSDQNESTEAMVVGKFVKENDSTRESNKDLDETEKCEENETEEMIVDEVMV